MCVCVCVCVCVWAGVCPPPLYVAVTRAAERLVLIAEEGPGATRARARAHTHTQHTTTQHERTHMHARTCTHAHTRTHSRTQHARMHTHAHTTHTHNKHTHARARARTHAQTFSCALKSLPTFALHYWCVAWLLTCLVHHASCVVKLLSNSKTQKFTGFKICVFKFNRKSAQPQPNPRCDDDSVTDSQRQCNRFATAA